MVVILTRGPGAVLETSLVVRGRGTVRIMQSVGWGWSVAQIIVNRLGISFIRRMIAVFDQVQVSDTL